MLRRLVLVALALLGILGPARAGDDGLGDAQRAKWEDAVRYLAALPPGPTINSAALVELSTRLTEFDPQVLLRMARYESLADHSEPLKPRLQHALRSLAYLRRLRPHMERAAAVCLLLGSDLEEHWARAIVEILREPLGKPLGQVADILSRDEHGVLRLGAGRIARYVNAFAGGSGSEWGDRLQAEWDPTPLVRRIAKRLLDDRNPAVACNFAMYDAYAFEDKAIIDMLIQRLDDERQRPAVTRGFLQGGERTVGDACRFCLSSQFIFYRKNDLLETAGIPRRVLDMHSRPQRRVTSLPTDDSPAEIARWWHEVRDQWSFRPDGVGWETVFDGTVIMKPYTERSLDTPFGAIQLSMPLYGESWRDRSPEFSIRVEARAKDKRLYVNCNMGNPSHHLGYVSGGKTGSGGSATVTSIMYAPVTPEGVRVRMRIWTIDPPSPGEHSEK